MIMNNMDVSIKNYQIIKKAELSFIPGLNIILGPSNNGKSSILKGIKALLYTTPGTTPIRQGETSYIIGLKYNGHVVLLQKGMKESVYVVDGEKYTKFGTTTPEAISKALNIKELVLNGQKEDLNFWDQMDYPFLLDKTAVELFRFVIDSGDNDRVSSALKKMVSDRQGLSKQIDITQGEINILDQDIDRYKEELELSKEKVEVSKKIVELQPKVARYKQLIALKSNLDTRKVTIEDTLKKLEKAKEYLFSLKSNYSDIYDTKTTLDILHREMGLLYNIIEDQSNVQEQITNIQKYKEIDIKTDLSKLKELKQIKSKIDQIRINKESIKLEKVPNIEVNYDKFLKIKTLKEILKKHEDINYKEVELETSKIAFKKSKELYEELLNNFEICPVCGQKFPHNNI